MSARRAIIREADLRRWVRIARDEGVALRGRINIDGSVVIDISPRLAERADNDGDLDDRLARFGAA